jgi:putative two-component system response regulator
VIVKAERQAGVRDDAILSLAKDIVYTHHERWDGSGYPQGLRGEAIPVAGRVLAIVDVYDAIVSRALYKAPMSHEDALAFIGKSRGTHFDPDVVDAFLVVAPEFKRVSNGVAQHAGAPVMTNS